MGQPTWGLRRFEYLSFLGRGGMGAVYEVLDRELGARVALKIVGSVAGQDLFRFKREFRAIRELFHPNIVRLGELFELDGEWGYTMELVPGVDLVRHVLGASPSRVDSSRGEAAHEAADEVSSTMIRSVTRRGAAHGLATEAQEQRLRRALSQLADALGFLHAHGRVHRDVKPSNVLVTGDERVVLLDFGLVKERSEERAPHDSAVVGTAAYMAPEQAAGGLVGPEADWYAVGAVLYEVLTGRLPFDGPPQQILLAKQTQDPSSPADHRPGLPADLVELCMALLARDPAARPRGGELPARLSAAAHANVLSLPRAHRSRVVCVGRDAELETLTRSLVDAGHRRARCVLVHGPSGIGKTTLVDRFLAELAERQPARAEPVLVLRGQCRQYEDVSFKAFDELFDALSTQLDGLEPHDLCGLRREHAAALHRAFPVLQRVPAIAQLAAAGGEEGDPKQLRMALYTGVRRLFRVLAQRRSLVLALEDVHWADADSWALVSELLRGQAAPPMLLLITARCELVRGEQREVVREVLSRPELEKLAMSALAREPAQQLVQLELGSAAGKQALVRGILDEAAGHPLLLTIMARCARERGAAKPLSLSEVVSAELAGVSALAREVLVAASLMAAPAERRVLAQALQVDAGLVSEQAEMLMAKKLLRSAGPSGAALEPHHDQVRSAVLEHVSGPDRIAWHRRLALALDDDSDARESAVHHYREAGDLRAASLAAERAAERAFRSLAFDRAARLMELSRSWCESAAERARLTRQLALALSYAGRSVAAAEQYLLAAESASGRAAVELRREAAVHLLAAGEHARGSALLRQALAELELPVPPSTWAALGRRIWMRARIVARGARYELGERPELGADARARLELCASTAVVLGTVDPIVGSYFGSLHQLLALRSGDREHIARALLTEGVYVSLIGDRARAAQLLAEARGAAGPQPSPFMAAYMAANQAAMEWADCDYRAALRSARASQQALAACPQRVSWELVTLELVETNALFFLGRYRELSRRAASCLRAAEERGDRYGVTNMLVSQASVRFLAQDRVDEAQAAIERGLEGWNTGSFDMQKLMALQSRAYVCLYRGEAERALERFEQVHGALRRSLLLRLPTYRALVWYVECQVRLAVAERAVGREQRAQLRRVWSLARKLERSPAPIGPAFASVVFASCAARVRGGLVTDLLDEALTRLELLGLDGYAAALRLRAARALDPNTREARALCDRGLRFMTDQDVKRAEQFACALVPSFESGG